MRILFWDTETSPISGYVWGLWDQNVGISQIIEPTHMICFGAMWEGTSKVIVKSIHADGKEEMLQTLWNLLDEADVLVSWNGKGFDTKHAMREFVEAGMQPPSPFKEMDLMLTVKNKFKAPSNKLDYWAGLLLGKQKVTHTGFQLWKDCMAGDEKAWALMYKYQRGDVTLLRDLYLKLQPWVVNHPNRALHDGIEFGCPACASTNLQARGKAITQVSVFQRWQCQDCGKWSRSRIRDTAVKTLSAL